jgi:hypothetical protein
MSELSQKFAPEADAIIRFCPAEDGGLPASASAGGFFITPIVLASESALGALDPLSATIWVGENLADGWCAARVGFLVPELARGFLVVDSKWIVTSGPRHLADLIVTRLLDGSFGG